MIQRLILLLSATLFLYMFSRLLGHTTAAMNLQSAGLVLVGTLVSVLLAYSMKNLKALWASLRRIFSKEQPDYLLLARQVEFLAYKTRRYGSKSLEEDLKKIDNAFLRKGMELVMDGYDRYDIRNIMEQEFEVYLAGRESQANILGTMSKLAPVFGFAGTIIGLINILSNIGEPSQIGQGMAVALLTTFYGLMFGNLLFMPLSKKLNEITRAEAAVFYILLDGITDMTEEKNSKAIAHKMRSSLALHNLIPALAAKESAEKAEEKYVGKVDRKLVFHQEGVCLKN